MLGLVVLLIFLVAVYVAMLSIMLIIERDKPKNMIIWSIIFLFTQLLGYITYAIIKCALLQKKKALIVKKQEDAIYANLVSKNLISFDNSHIKCADIFRFNKLVYDADFCKNNVINFVDSLSEIKKTIKTDIMSAKKYINIEATTLDSQFLLDNLDNLSKLANSGVVIKIVTERHISNKLKKSLKANGIKIYYFNKKLRLSAKYQDLRNAIVVDGKVAILANLMENEKNPDKETSYMFLQVKGNIVQDIDFKLFQDVVFASGKYFEKPIVEFNSAENDCTAQYICNDYNTNLELLIVKAISMAKKSIQLHLKEFIPTESIMSLLKFAIDSNVEVKLMVPITPVKHSKYYASRAYAKELALFGADVYLFDGYIKSNSITIDNEYVIYGSYIMDREHLATSLQSALLVNDGEVVKSFNKIFEKNINNSYKIKDAKYMLIREKFFKNFV